MAINKNFGQALNCNEQLTKNWEPKLKLFSVCVGCEQKLQKPRKRFLSWGFESATMYEKNSEELNSLQIYHSFQCPGKSQSCTTGSHQYWTINKNEKSLLRGRRCASLLTSLFVLSRCIQRNSMMKFHTKNFCLFIHRVTLFWIWRN